MDKLTSRFFLCVISQCSHSTTVFTMQRPLPLPSSKDNQERSATWSIKTFTSRVSSRVLVSEGELTLFEGGKGLTLFEGGVA